MVMSIVLYTTYCPKCKVLETKLNQKNIQFELNDNVRELIKKGYAQAPMLEVDGELMDFGEAVKWVDKQ